MWIKICGITDESMAEAICGLSPDAIGLNFHPRSPRCVSREVAARIARVVPEEVLRVGVFVNRDASEIEDLANECRLDEIQLHGDESPAQIAEVCRRLPDIPIIRAAGLMCSLTLQAVSRGKHSTAAALMPGRGCNQ